MFIHNFLLLLFYLKPFEQKKAKQKKEITYSLLSPKILFFQDWSLASCSNYSLFLWISICITCTQRSGLVPLLVLPVTWNDQADEATENLKDASSDLVLVFLRGSSGQCWAVLFSAWETCVLGKGTSPRVSENVDVDYRSCQHSSWAAGRNRLNQILGMGCCVETQ